MNVLASVAIGAAAPGVYRSADTPSSGNNNLIDLAYTPPLPSGLDCSARPARGQACPPGCAMDGECVVKPGDAGVVCAPPCVPQSTQVDWSASVLSGVPSSGAWTVTLKSVVPVVVESDSGLPAGARQYRVHGSLEAELVGGGTIVSSGGAKPTTSLSLSF